MITVWLLIFIRCLSADECGTSVIGLYATQEACLVAADDLAVRDGWHDLPTGYGCQEGQQEPPPRIRDAGVAR